MIVSELRAEITSLNHRGEGVGKITRGPDKGLIVFIPNTVPGDVVEYSVMEKKSKFMRGKVLKVIKSGAGRVAALCPVADKCGGCTWQHIDYKVQLEWKRRIVEEALARIAKIHDCPVKDCIPSPKILGYRNKVEVPLALHKGKVVAGFYAPYTHKVIPSEDCPLEHPLAREIISGLLEEVRAKKYSIYDERTGRGQIRHLVARVAPGTNERMAILVANANHLRNETALAKNLMEKYPGLKSVVLNTNKAKTNVIMGDKERLLAGRRYIEDEFGSDELGYLKFRLSPRSFYQVNYDQAVAMYKLAIEAGEIGPGDLVYDVYSGIGTITLFAAKYARYAVGIEEVGPAVRDARKNAKINNIDNVGFVEGKAERVLPATLAKYGKPSIVILDPPRGGAEEKTLLSLAKVNPRSMVYVSCNPATLARDLITLGEQGWKPQWCRPVDMFPMTGHVECVVLIRRVQQNWQMLTGESPVVVKVGRPLSQ